MFQWSFNRFIFELGQGHMLGAASLTLFLYDIVLTFDQEVALIYVGFRWTFPKFLYLFNRYFVLSVMVINTLVLLSPDPSYEVCNFAVRYSGLGGMISKYILDLWLILRVYAIWGRDHKVIIALGFFFLANVCVACVINGISFHNTQTIRLPGPRPPGNIMPGCFVTPPSPHIWVIFLSSLVFEVAVFVFTLWKAVRHMRSAELTPRETPLLTHLYRTGIVYFAVMALTMAFMSITALIPPLTQVVLPSQFLSAFVSTVCARMMLGIRAVIKGDDHFSALRPSDMHIPGFQLTPLGGERGVPEGQMEDARTRICDHQSLHHEEGGSRSHGDRRRDSREEEVGSFAGRHDPNPWKDEEAGPHIQKHPHSFRSFWTEE